MRTRYMLSLTALVELATISIGDASAEHKVPIYDPAVTDYLTKLLDQNGTVVYERTVDGQSVSVTTTIRQIADAEYDISTHAMINGTNITNTTSEAFSLIVNADGTYGLVNKRHQINETFTNVTQGPSGTGSGSSSVSGASITLYDKEYGTVGTLTLDDGYSGCATFNQAVFQATIRNTTVDVTWEASPAYFHWCLMPHMFDHMTVQYGTETRTMEGQSIRRSSSVFTNYGMVHDWYSVRLHFVYR